MAAEDVERANRRLAGKESFTVAPSRYLGHYVAGHLASRLGIVVELQDSPAGGITARIDVPMGLLADDELDRPLAQAPAPPPAASPSPSPPARPPPRCRPRRPSAACPDAASGACPLAAGVDAAPSAEPSEPAGRAGAAAGARAAADPRTPAPVAHAAPPSRAAPEPVSRDDRRRARRRAAPASVGLAVAQPPGTSMYSVAAHNARAGEQRRAPRRERAWPGGCPGAQRPGRRHVRPAQSSRRPTEPPRTSPEDVYSFLSNFQSGVARGRADAASETPDESPGGRAMNQPQTLSEEARSFSWLLNGFVEKTAGVTDAVAVSSDGLLMAMSSSLNRASAEQLAAIISGMVSLGNGASSCFGFDGLEQVIVTMRRGFLFVSSISDGSCLGVVSSARLRHRPRRLPDHPARRAGRHRPHPGPGRRAEAGDAGVMTERDEAHGGHDFVRPFIMTGGRTRAERRDLRVETMLQASVDDVPYGPPLRAGGAPAAVPASRSRWPRWPPSSTSSSASSRSSPATSIATGLLDVHHTDPVEIELDMLTKMIERVRAI